ncbi:ferrous iron transport protein B [Oleidesulfovibrio sp.]|uniref:ferrous iron transport protein B n=1 Tax=Oleidesulfovibrio sp. TaxID=2909707 RepID=UPI003A892496
MKMTTIALAGNPNSGKTTAFNALTGARQHVGNYPGITVDKKEGRVRLDGREVHIIDLPGTYSLTAYTQEELVARNYVVDERPDVVLDVVNAGALERNLYLAVQFLEMGVPVALGLNMMDEARKQGIEINTAKLSAIMGIPVTETVARTGEGVTEMLEKAVKHADATKDKPWQPLVISYGADIDPVLSVMSQRIESEGFLNKYPARWVAIKYIEGDEEMMRIGREEGPLALELEDQVKELADHLKRTLNTYPEAVIADYRYGFIASALRDGVIKRRDEMAERMQLSDKLDKVLTHQLFGPAIMLGLLYLIYHVTFAIGEIPMGWVEEFFGWMNEAASAALPDGLLKSLIVSGIIDGVGGVMGFVPLIMFMFFQIAFLEDSGYMARIAYMLDRVFRMFGLHGCSVMPFIVSGGIAGGCAVPGVMASRTLRSRREKLATLITAPFMACGAKVPVFILFVGIFFAENEAAVMFSLTLGGWVAALLVARLLRSTFIKGESTPFVMELPPYRIPTLRGLLIHTWERTWQYIKKAGTVILAISILLWVAMTFPELPESEVAKHEAQRQQISAQIETATAEGRDVAPLEDALAAVDADEAMNALRNSAAGRVGTAIESVTSVAGFDWRTNIALVGGIAAKEVIVSTLGTSYSLGEVDPEESGSLADRIANDPTWTPSRAMALMLFVLLYAPCFVTVVAIKQEAGSWKWAVFSVVFNTVLAFGVATAVYQLGSL